MKNFNRNYSYPTGKMNKESTLIYEWVIDWVTIYGYYIKNDKDTINFLVDLQRNKRTRIVCSVYVTIFK